jgi:FAD/FMN-containing dehydrogenase
VHLIVSTQRLNHIIEHQPADLIAITEAGVTLKDFNHALAKNGQWLPLDPPDDGHATIGGVVATGLGGAQQFGYGAPRRHVIGMKVVLADGSLIKIGGRVVKNVAGYDLCKLFTGNYGTLGIIVEVNFKLRALPFEMRSVIIRGESEELLLGARRVLDSRLFPVATEILSPALAHETALPQATEHALLLRFAGAVKGVRHQIDSACALLSNDAPGRLSVVSDDDELWGSLAALPLRFQGDLVSRIGGRPSDIGALVAYLDDQETTEQSSGLTWQASVGDGRIRVIDRLCGNGEKSDDLSRAIRRFEGLKAEAESLGATVTIEHAPCEIKSHVGSWGNFGAAGTLMQRIKRQLDPNDILSPGRFGFGGPAIIGK